MTGKRSRLPAEPRNARGWWGCTEPGASTTPSTSCGFRHPDQGSEISRVLQAFGKHNRSRRGGEEGTARRWPGGWQVARIPRGESLSVISSRSVASISSGRRGSRGSNRRPRLSAEKLRSREHGFQLEAGAQSFPDQVGAFENQSLVFTSSEPPNILQIEILSTGDHGERSYGLLAAFPIGEIQVAVGGDFPDKLLGVREGFQRYFHQGLERSVSVAVFPQPQDEASTPLPLTDQATLDLAPPASQGPWPSRPPSDTAFASVPNRDSCISSCEGQNRYFVRSWSVVVGLGEEAWGSSGTVQLPNDLIEGLDGPDIPFAIPGRRRSGGMVSSLTGGMENRPQRHCPGDLSRRLVVDVRNVRRSAPPSLGEGFSIRDGCGRPVLQSDIDPDFGPC